MQGRITNARTIVENELVAQRIEQSKKKAPFLDDMYEGLKWLLSRSPQSGQQIPETEYFIAKTYNWRPGGVPAITILYQFDEDHVYFESSKIDWPK